MGFMPKLPLIDKPLPLAKLAYESLRDTILAGDMVVGKIYSEKVIAEQMGISKTPVREALLELSAQGLISFLPRRGVTVMKFSQKDVEEVFEVRLFIEMSVAEKAARHLDSIDLTYVKKALGAQERCICSDDKEKFVEADREFHLAFAELINNRRLSVLQENVRDLIQVFGKEALIKGTRPKEVVAEHHRILDAILAGDSDMARSAMSDHIINTKRLVLEALHGKQLLA
jgi:DNA-binding GntR family transcriptional regulator